MTQKLCIMDCKVECIHKERYCMESKREATKIKLKKQILKSAVTVFLKNGYENTTISQIAKDAGVGTGTAYNYFDSKADLFIQTMESIIENEKNNFAYHIEYLDENPITEFSKKIKKLFHYIMELDKELLKEFFSVIFGTLSKNNYYMKRFYQLDDYYLKQIQYLLNHYVDRGKFSEDFDVESCSLLIFSTVTMHTLEYLHSEDYNEHKINLILTKQIQFILQDKIIG